MKVWIDQDLCTGDGLCTDHCPNVFVLLEDGISYVREHGVVRNDPGGASSAVTVQTREERHVIDAAEACPGECIFVEPDDPPRPQPQDNDPIIDAEVVNTEPHQSRPLSC